MENSKMTYVQALDYVLAGNPMTEAVREKLTKLRDNQANRTGGDKKPTERDNENRAIERSIVKFLSEHPDERFTITQLWKDVPGLPDDMSNQRMNSLVQHLLSVYGKEMDKEGTGEVIRIEDKRKTYFAINPDYVPTDEEEGD